MIWLGHVTLSEAQVRLKQVLPGPPVTPPPPFSTKTKSKAETTWTPEKKSSENDHSIPLRIKICRSPLTHTFRQDVRTKGGNVQLLRGYCSYSANEW